MVPSAVTMSMFHLIFFIWVLLSASYSVFLGCASWFPHHFVQQSNHQFEQKTDRFWEFREETNSWIEVDLPYDLVSCVNDNCTKVGSIDQTGESEKVATKQHESLIRKDGGDDGDGGGEEDEGSCDIVLPLRKRISVTKMSEASIWVTGVSGCVYERFWNGVQWVIAPHDLPTSAGPAISVFIINQTILALSEAGVLYQMQLGDNSQPIWVEFSPAIDHSRNHEAEQKSLIQIKSGAVSPDGKRVYFCTKNGLLLELSEVDFPRWLNHGQPPGANVAAVSDAGNIRPEVVYTISSTGELYEYDRNSKPSWKKHIWSKGNIANASLIPSTGVTMHGLTGDYSVSLFLLTKGGKLVERRIQQRKWKWIVHGSPREHHHLTSITAVQQDESNEKFCSLFLTTSVGAVYEYQIPKYSGSTQENQNSEGWISHKHPSHTKVATGVVGIPLQLGRTLFPLDDGRLAELHLSGLGGENAGPTNQLSVRRKSSVKYIWSVLDAPESEGWNAEYCTEERGPTNCMAGTKDEPNDLSVSRTARRRKGNQPQYDYLTPSASLSDGRTQNAVEEYSLPDNWTNTYFRMRVMHGGRSLFLVTEEGFTFEYLNAESVWLWLRHDHPTPMSGLLGNYNGSLYMVDVHGSLLIRERSSNVLAWINCTAMRKGRQVMGGPPWDGLTGKAMKVTAEDALFFVSKTGRLLQFTVALRKFKWKDCRHPLDTKVACIVDGELFRENIVFVVGRNRRLYQYNKVTELWHEHYQSQHLVLSILPGTAMRPSSASLTGSLFMLSIDGGLVEYHWNSWDGWNWVEHGTPDKGVVLVGSPGPSFHGNQLLLIGSDGKVYLRYMDQMTWRWKGFGFPHTSRKNADDLTQVGQTDSNEEFCNNEDFEASLEMEAEELKDLRSHCDPKVSGTKPIPFSEDSVIFELRDGRLGEMQRVHDTQWEWTRTIATPTTSCFGNYWTAVAS